ncbi:LacI family DNA-binding transcriptional regulator [Streptomyces sp. NPDC047002]|uniref:LacI family DNA-binding transcriptional regulator n=1 Tax=Streptomyces sp. NPDC047002 TaxID=3155475 RepID=UPI003456BBF1
MRRVTLADVARAAGVAKATASRALSADNPEVGAATRVRIREIAAELGYQPSAVAQALSTGRVRLIVLFVPAAEPGWAQVLAGAMAEAERRGYQVLVRPLGADAPREQSGLPVDGAVLVGPARVPAGWDASRPVVVVDEDLFDAGATVVRTANWSAGYQAGRHLIEQQRRSALVLVPHHRAGGVQARAAGCQAAFAEAGAELPSGRVVEAGRDADPGAGLDAALGRGVRPDGVFACTDETAVAALGSLGRAGLRVPGDVALVCFGDESLAGQAGPSLAVIPRPAAELGARAVQLLVRAIEGAAEPAEVHELPVRLVPGAPHDRPQPAAGGSVSARP